ncbi:hypothetical protein QBC47DRAFT_203529 [Echria macrotheca]|uniref:Uncharacterized protein n=1 Tax=Echria macrotheca TaxID=438768 RepID=A0AAJ0BAW8_9PEZI|nr:hypothetical protein QBC47DRAFT_203529 [Echria macrotheca]
MPLDKREVTPTRSQRYRGSRWNPKNLDDHATYLGTCWVSQCLAKVLPVAFSSRCGCGLPRPPFGSRRLSVLQAGPIGKDAETWDLSYIRPLFHFNRGDPESRRVGLGRPHIYRVSRPASDFEPGRYPMATSPVDEDARKTFVSAANRMHQSLHHPNRSGIRRIHGDGESIHDNCHCWLLGGKADGYISRPPGVGVGLATNLTLNPPLARE